MPENNRNFPEITVLMPVYNSDKFVAECLESILNQTFENFEFLIINDGSTDKSVEIIEGYDDPRIRLVHNEENIGLTKSLNKGLNLAKGSYIARIDADDISLPHRLKKQFQFMEKNPDIDACGSWVKIIGQDTLWQSALTDTDIKIRLLFHNNLYHPTAMFKKDCFAYPESYKQSQDYAVWAFNKLKLANIPEVLLEYRLHEGQIGKISGKHQGNLADNIRLELLNKLGIEPSHEEFDLHKSIGSDEFKDKSPDYLKAARVWINRLIEANKGKNLYPAVNFEDFLEQKFFSICENNLNLGLKTWFEYKKLACYNKTKSKLLLKGCLKAEKKRIKKFICTKFQ